MAELFLLDTSVFITPHRLYYSFDIAQSFWAQLEEKLKLDNIFVLDKVVAEVTKREDELSEWINNLEDFHPLSVKSPGILKNYSEVLSYVQQCALYQETAFRDWARSEIADPWLIAAAMEKDATIITAEETAGSGISPNNPSRKAKIPDVAKHFGIKCETLFYFMRQTGIKL